MEPSVSMYSHRQWSAIFAQLKPEGNEAAVEALSPARPDTTTLIIADADLGHQSLSDGMASLGLRAITVRQPLDAFIGLQDASLAISAVLASVHDPRCRTLEFFELMRDEFPLVRRIAYAKTAAEDRDALRAGLLDFVLTYPTPLKVLAEALQRAPEVAPLQGDKRSEQQLCQAWKGEADRRAFEELDRRYRPRIRQLAILMRFSEEDAQEIVQETLLALFLGRRTFDGTCEPDRFIYGLAARSVLECLRGEQRQTRLLLALARAATVDRAAREQNGQPDIGLAIADLTAHADAAICSLPATLRRVFWLRAVEEQSADDAGAALDLAPSMVDKWLLCARGLIADQLRPLLA